MVSTAQPQAPGQLGRGARECGVRAMTRVSGLPSRAAGWCRLRPDVHTRGASHPAASRSVEERLGLSGAELACGCTLQCGRRTGGTEQMAARWSGWRCLLPTVHGSDGFCAQLLPCAVHTARRARVLAAMLCGISSTAQPAERCCGDAAVSWGRSGRAGLASDSARDRDRLPCVSCVQGRRAWRGMV